MLSFSVLLLIVMHKFMYYKQNDIYLLLCFRVSYGSTPRLLTILHPGDTAHKLKIFKCEQCRTSTTKYSTHLQHINSCDKHYCQVCKKTFHSTFSFKNHLRKNCPPQIYCCTNCKKSYSRKCDRDRHTRKCTKTEMVKCDTCQALFLTNCWLENHKQTCHMNN